MSFLPYLASASSIIGDSAKQACGDHCGATNISTIFANVTNALIFLVGGISVIMIIIGGLRYVTSNGDAKSTEGAKNTIMYAVMGIIVAIAGYAIVNFVVTQIGK
jgi:TRAP-type C4-dicarboxylate transport system permease small subunit